MLSWSGYDDKLAQFSDWTRTMCYSAPRYGTIIRWCRKINPRNIPFDPFVQGRILRFENYAHDNYRLIHRYICLLQEGRWSHDVAAGLLLVNGGNKN